MYNFLHICQNKWRLIEFKVFLIFLFYKKNCIALNFMNTSSLIELSVNFRFSFGIILRRENIFLKGKEMRVN
jgi:hypothetical protein